MVFLWSLIDSKSLQISRTLFSILANFNNPVVQMVLICFLISNFSSLLSKPLDAPLTIDITLTRMLYNFLSS